MRSGGGGGNCTLTDSFHNTETKQVNTRQVETDQQVKSTQVVTLTGTNRDSVRQAETEKSCNRVAMGFREDTGFNPEQFPEDLKKKTILTFIY